MPSERYQNRITIIQMSSLSRIVSAGSLARFIGRSSPRPLVTSSSCSTSSCLTTCTGTASIISNPVACNSIRSNSFLLTSVRFFKGSSHLSSSFTKGEEVDDEASKSRAQYEHDRYWKGLSEDEFNHEYGNRRKALASHNSQGEYDKALAVAKEMEEAVRVAKGKKNLMFASAVNNVALMLKNLGEMELSLDKYIESLQAYDAVVGKMHIYYSATLANLGSLYKTMAEGSKGVDKIEYLQRANEALNDALEIRKKLNGDTNDRESLLIAVNMASVKRIEGKLTESEGILLSTLAAANQLFGEINVLTSTIYNNLGICVKLQSRYSEAEFFYRKALDARRKIYGEDHNEVIVVMYNIAELYLAQNREDDSKKIQEEVLAILEKKQGGEGGSLIDKLESMNKEGAASDTKEPENKPFNPLDVKVYHTTTRKKNKKPTDDSSESK